MAGSRPSRKREALHECAVRILIRFTPFVGPRALDGHSSKSDGCCRARRPREIRKNMKNFVFGSGRVALAPDPSRSRKNRAESRGSRLRPGVVLRRQAVPARAGLPAWPGCFSARCSHRREGFRIDAAIRRARDMTVVRWWELKQPTHATRPFKKLAGPSHTVANNRLERWPRPSRGSLAEKAAR